MKRACLIAISMTVGAFAGACDKDGDLGDTGAATSPGEGGGEAGGEAEAEGGEAEGGEDEGEGGEADSGEADSGEADSGESSYGSGEESNATTGVGESGTSGDTEGQPELCDPLLQDCPEGDACVFVDDAFQCLLDESEDTGASGDPCELVNECDPGLFCGDGSQVACPPGQDTCCSWFCDVSDAGDFCGASECVPFFPDGEAPPGLEDVGYCDGG